ncbi:MAG: DUF1127 domain-containing protein [Betaproteobacteria bacterium]|nr:DUF1127 domain-containing protein [Betaproteobacteria bacterium]
MNATLKIHSAASAAQSVQLVLSHVLDRIFTLTERVGRAVREEIEAERAIHDLASLSERQLRDIGLMRSDIEAAVRGLNHFSR